VRKKQKKIAQQRVILLYFFYNTNLIYLKSIQNQTGSQWKEGQKDRRIEREREREREREKD
jgi:hypothetical protein